MGGDGSEVCMGEVCLCHYDNLQGSACCELAQSQMPSYGIPVLPWVLHHKKVMLCGSMGGLQAVLGISCDPDY